MWEQVTTWYDRHKEDTCPCLTKRCKAGRRAREDVAGMCMVGEGLAGLGKGNTGTSEALEALSGDKVAAEGTDYPWGVCLAS